MRQRARSAVRRCEWSRRTRSPRRSARDTGLGEQWDRYDVMTTSQLATWRRLLPLLVCPECRRSLSILASFAEGDAVLGHASGECHERYPVIGGVPRLLTGAARGRLYRDLSPWFRDERASRWFSEWAPQQKTGSLGGTVVSRFDREWE